MQNNTDFLKPIGSKSTVDRIIDELTDAILCGRWKPGDKIPTETELAAAFNTARNSVREAIKVLVSLGLLNIRRASGTYVATSFSDKMLNPLIYSFALESGSTKELLELRQMFHQNCVSLAIKNAHPEDFDRIRQSCDDYVALLKDDTVTAEQLLDADIAFHDSVSQATHNILLQRISYVIERIGRPNRLESMKYVISINQRSYLIESHQELARVILERKSDEVKNIVENSFRYLEIASK